MEREKFDNALSSAILKHEETPAPSFDRNGVWRKTRGNRNGRNFAAVISAAAMVLLALNYFLPGDGKDTVGKEKSAINKTAVVIKEPSARPKTEELSTAPLKKAYDKYISIPATPEIIETEPVVQENKQDPVYSENKMIPEVPSAPVQSIIPPPVAESVKVTFKRGKPAQEIQPVIKITFMKGVKPKFNPRESTLSDSSYYVNRNNPFKLKFKL